MTKTPPTAPTPWHRLLGEVLEKLLTPVDLSVYTEIEDYLTHLKQSPRAKTANAKPKPKKRK